MGLMSTTRLPIGNVTEASPRPSVAESRGRLPSDYPVDSGIDESRDEAPYISAVNQMDSIAEWIQPDEVPVAMNLRRLLEGGRLGRRGRGGRAKFYAVDVNASHPRSRTSYVDCSFWRLRIIQIPLRTRNAIRMIIPHSLKAGTPTPTITVSFVSIVSI